MKQQSDDKATNIRNRTFEFAVRIVKLCHYLFKRSGVSKTLANQLLKSETSMGANI